MPVNRKLNTITNNVIKSKLKGSDITRRTVGDLSLSATKNINLDTGGGKASISDGGYQHFLFDCDNTLLAIYDDTDDADYCAITVGTSGHTNIDSTGYVGIGGVTPTSPFHVESSASSYEMLIKNTNDNGKGLLITAGGGASGTTPLKYMLDVQNKGGTSKFIIDGLGRTYIKGGNNASLGTADSGYLILGDTGGTNIVIDDNEIMARNNGSVSPLYLQAEGGDTILCRDAGEVGIGTASPSAPLHVQTDPGEDQEVCLIRNSRSSPDADDVVLGLAFSGTDATDGIMVKFTDGNHTLGNINVVAASGTAIQYATSSDYRMKENANAITDALTRVNQLKPYRLNYIGNDNTIDSFFAHEVMDILPYAGSGVKDEVYPEGHSQYGQIKPQQLSYGAMVPVLVACIQELSAKVTALENA